MSQCYVSVIAPRLDAKPWGGRSLSQFGLPLPEGEKIGEALVTANDAFVAAGMGEGETLGDIVARDPHRYLGNDAFAAVGERPIFPLLVKLIDAAENLSIQVHPDDGLAAPLHSLGKTEAWYVLAAEHQAALYLGLEPHVELTGFMEHAHLLNGASSVDLRRIIAHPGQTWMIPAGTVHALGAGVMVYEIQQPSAITFRLDDWGRVDTDGNPREMHLEQGERAIRPELRPREIPAIRLDVRGERQLLVACRYFALEKLSLAGGAEARIGQATTPNVITVLSGELQVADWVLSAGESAVIWPGTMPVSCVARGEAVALRAWVPDLLKDIAEPVRAVGGLDSDIAALGGMSGDIERALEAES